MNIKVRVLAPFPSDVSGSGVISVDKANGKFKIGYDQSKLLETTVISDASLYEAVIEKLDTGILTRAKLSLFGGGTVTGASVVTANGLAGTVATSTSTPAITLRTTVTGMVKGNGTALSAATSGTDYAPGTAANATGIVKSTTTTGALTTAIAADFPTLNQNTTGSAASFTGSLAGDVTGTQAATIVGKVNGVALSGLATGILKNTTTTGVPSIATVGTDYTAGTAALGTGILKNTTGTGAHTIAVAGDFPTLNQNTTGTAASATAFTGSLVGDVGGTQGATVIGANAVTLGKLATLAANSVIGNNTGSAATPAALTPSQLLDIIGSVQGVIPYRNASTWTVLSPGTAGQVLQSGGAGANPSWLTVTGTGTVTSVGLSLTGGIFTVSGSPITGAGTLTGTLATQLANNVLAGPTTGSAATPTFRTLVGADLNSIGSNWGDVLFRGTAGWTTLAPGTSGQVLKTNGVGSDPTWFSVTGTGTVTTLSVATANGLAGTVATATSTPVITLTTSVTGVLKGNGTAISAAVANTDYQSPISLTTTGTSGAATFTSNTLNIPTITAATASAIWVGTSTTTYNTPKNIADSHAWQTLTSGATPAWDTALGYNARIVLATNATFAAPTNLIDGRTYTLLIVQDATGTRTGAFNTIWDFGGAGAPTLSTVAASRDLVVGIYDATTTKLVSTFRKGT
jgi:hypothetical protein